MNHLLIDGSNILHAWPELCALGRRDKNAARAQLVQRVAILAEPESMRVTVVFDGRGPDLTVEQPSALLPLAIIVTGSAQTADDVIEKLAARHVPPSEITVATGDGAERQLVISIGANVLSPDELAAWVGRAETGVGAQLAGLRRENARKWNAS